MLPKQPSIFEAVSKVAMVIFFQTALFGVGATFVIYFNFAIYFNVLAQEFGDRIHWSYLFLCLGLCISIKIAAQCGNKFMNFLH